MLADFTLTPLLLLPVLIIWLFRTFVIQPKKTKSFSTSPVQIGPPPTIHYSPLLLQNLQKFGWLNWRLVYFGWKVGWLNREDLRGCAIDDYSKRLQEDDKLVLSLIIEENPSIEFIEEFFQQLFEREKQPPVKTPEAWEWDFQSPEADYWIFAWLYTVNEQEISPSWKVDAIEKICSNLGHPKILRAFDDDHHYAWTASIETLFAEFQALLAKMTEEFKPLSK